MRLWSGLLLVSLLSLCSGDVHCNASGGPCQGTRCFIIYYHKGHQQGLETGCATFHTACPKEKNTCYAKADDQTTRCCCDTDYCNTRDFIEKRTTTCKKASGTCHYAMSCYRETREQEGKYVDSKTYGCDRTGKCLPSNLPQYNCTTPGATKTCCCFGKDPQDPTQPCNKEYFWLTCLDTQGKLEYCSEKSHQQPPATGACYVKRNKDGFVVRGCERETAEECYALEKSGCRDHEIETVCCCNEPNCNTEDKLLQVPLICSDWEKGTTTKCQEGTKYCYGRSWVQGGKREIDMRNGSGCDTGTKFCEDKKHHECTPINAQAPHEQTCCCKGPKKCNQHPFFWLKCLDSNGEEEHCSEVAGKEPTGNCYVTKSFSSEGNATGGCEWKSEKEEDMPCSNIGWNAAVDNTHCHIDTKKNTKTCCCVESNCNDPGLATTTTIATTAGQGKTNGHQTMIVLALFTRLSHSLLN